ncbi:MAG: alpha-ketoacid dehydrogenase subunit alpha/beta [Anaerolineales bacterium]
MNNTDWLRVARLALTSRWMDTIEEKELAPAGKIMYQFSARGHELSQILMGLSATHPRDGLFGYYRSRALALALGATPEELFASGMAKTGGPSEGRDAGVLISFHSRGGATMLPTPGDVGSQYSPAAGWAQALVYRRTVLKETEYDGAIAVVHGGDGSTAANGFWASLNIATTLKLPVLYFIEDNGYAISVPGHMQSPGANIADNLASFRNLHILQASGVLPPETSAAVAEAVSYVRAGHGPCLLRLSVPRLAGHSITDNQAYKTPEQRAEEESRDPVRHMSDYVTELLRADWETLNGEVEAEVRAALAEAERHPEPEPGSATRFVFSAGNGSRVESLIPNPSGLRINLIEGVKRVLDSELNHNPHVLVFGEDVGVKGGVHGATVDLQRKFGEARVFDTSLNEEGIIGRAVGMALNGLKPVPEIQFRKYVDPATEALNTAGWLRWRTAGKFSAPMVIRVPVGLGKKSNDPFHTVTGEATLVRMLGWRVAFPSNAEDAVGLLRGAIRGDDPTFFFEHRSLLDTAPARRPYPGDNYVLPFGVAATVMTGDGVTVVTWGEMVYRCLEAAQEFAGRVEIIDLRTIAPWDRECVLTSVRKTGKCLVVHEDTLTAGFAAEIIATIASEAFQYLDAPARRLGVPDCPIPYNAGMMQTLVPGVEGIRRELANLLAF